MSKIFFFYNLLSLIFNPFKHGYGRYEDFKAVTKFMPEESLLFCKSVPTLGIKQHHTKIIKTSQWIILPVNQDIKATRNSQRKENKIYQGFSNRFFSPRIHQSITDPMIDSPLRQCPLQEHSTTQISEDFHLESKTENHL